MNKEELDKTVSALTESTNELHDLMEETNNGEAWPTLTGLPSTAVDKLLEWAVVKDVGIEDLLLTVAGIAFAHGRKIGREATNSKAATSESA